MVLSTSPLLQPESSIESLFRYSWNSNISESTKLKFNYSHSFVLTTTLIYKYSLQWVWVQCWHQTHNIRNVFDSNAYSFRLINLEKHFRILVNDTSAALIKIYSLSCCCIYKERRNKKAKTASKANTQASTEYCSVRMRIIHI